MIIGIDASRANREIKTGVEWYSYRIIQELKKILPDSVRVVLYTDKSLRGDLANLPPNWQEKILKWPLRYLWTQGRLSLEMLFNPPDVLFVPSSAIPFICPTPPYPPLFRQRRNRGGRVFTTIHDIGFKRFPKCYGFFQRLYLDWSTRFALKKCAKIFVPSEFTKKELIEHYGADLEKIIVTPLSSVIPRSGSDEESRGSSDEIGTTRETDNAWVVASLLPRDSSLPLVAQNDGRVDYILFIGRLTEKKNISRIIEAFKLFKTENPDSKLKLVLVGPTPTPSLPLREGEGKGGGDIIHFNWLSPSKTSTLLKNAKALIFPSLYEGFGLPILEAFAAGVPVITSKGIATEEVARLRPRETGTSAWQAEYAAILVNPQNISEIKNAIKQIISDKNLRQILIQKGLERVKDFSWQKTAEITWENISGQGLDILENL